MKTIKRIFAVLLAVLIVMGLSVAAFADGDPQYSISINNAVDGQTYKAYKIFDATHDGDKVSYSISTNSEWYPIMVDYRQNATGYAEGETPISSTYNPFTFTASAADPTVMVVGLNKKPADELSSVDAYAVDAAALAAYLNTKLHAEGASFTAAATGTAVTPEGGDVASVTLDVTSKGEGYYFVDTSVGALCSLDTVTGAGVEINEKNSLPNIKKSVKEDDDGEFKESAVLDVIDTVYYKLQVNAGIGADENYVIVDELPAGFVYEADSIAVSCEKTNPTAWVSDDDYTVSYDSDKLTITLLSSGKLGGLNDADPIVITYNASMTPGAVQIGAGTSNINTATLTYKEKSQSVSASVMTYKIGSGLTKVDGANSNPLAGVEFILSKDVTVGGTTTTYYAKLDAIDGGTGVVTGYMLKEWTTGAEATPIITDAYGKIDLKGLDSGEYILTETGTLQGYNLLTDTITVMVADTGAVTYRMTNAAEDILFADAITIENNSGTELPSTGGMGTTVLYVVGIVLIAGAFILLIVRTRKSGKQK